MSGAAITQINAGAGKSGGYRLDVIAPNILDGVSLVGGWAFDCAMAGWKVTFVLANVSPDSGRCARVLGAGMAEYGAIRCSGWPRPYGIAVVGTAVHDDDVRRFIERTSLSGGVELNLVTDVERSGRLYDRMFHPLRYRPSRAAIAFKTRSLITAGMSSAPTDSDTEQLFCAFRGRAGIDGNSIPLMPGVTESRCVAGTAGCGDRLAEAFPGVGHPNPRPRSLSTFGIQPATRRDELSPDFLR